MIVYNLRCKNGHEFEGWFRDSAAFDVQAEERQADCARPAIRAGWKKRSWRPPLPASDRKSDLTNPEARKMRQFMTGLRKYVQENAEYVGPKFAEEARKIHYGETVDRHIYGETTLEEAQRIGRGGRRCRSAAARSRRRELIFGWHAPACQMGYPR